MSRKRTSTQVPTSTVTIVRWDNPVTMPCQSTSAHQGHMADYSGGGSYTCQKPAMWVSVENGTAVEFYCDRHRPNAPATDIRDIQD